MTNNNVLLRPTRMTPNVLEKVLYVQSESQVDRVKTKNVLDNIF